MLRGQYGVREDGGSDVRGQARKAGGSALHGARELRPARRQIIAQDPALQELHSTPPRHGRERLFGLHELLLGGLHLLLHGLNFLNELHDGGNVDYRQLRVGRKRGHRGACDNE